MRKSLLLAAGAAALLGCSSEFHAPSSGYLVSAKGGPKSPPVTYAHIEWDDSFTATVDGQAVPAGIRGDGRQADGSAGSSGYQGNLCGVNAFFDVADTGDMRFDEYTATACGEPRVHFFYFAGAAAAPTAVATKTVARALWTMAVGESRTDQREGFHAGLLNCDRVVYGDAYAGSTNPRRTRLPDVNGARQWYVESQGSHQARCVYSARGKEWTGDLTVPMPFAYTITEVVNE